MTNAIGTGTCNVTVNVPADERKQLVRLASAMSQSMGDLMRRITLKGLEGELADIESRLCRDVGIVSKESEILLIRRAEALRQTVQTIRSTREKYYGAVMTATVAAVFVEMLWRF